MKKSAETFIQGQSKALSRVEEDGDDDGDNDRLFCGTADHALHKK